MTTAEVYDRYHRRLWPIWWEHFRAALAREWPATGGSEHFVHNWITCGRNEAEAKRSRVIRDDWWARWRRIAARGDREYRRIEHRSHGIAPGYFRPLWCAYCQGRES